MENEAKNHDLLKGIISVLVEIAIILALTVIVVFALNYFKLINIGLLFSPEASLTNASSDQNALENKSAVVPSPVVLQRRANPALPNLQLIAKNKALHNEFQAFEFEGNIDNVSSTPGIDRDSKIPYAARIVVGIGTQSAQVNLDYPKSALSKIKVADSQGKKLEFTDLKKGDSVVIRTVLSTYLQYPNNYFGVTITKK